MPNFDPKPAAHAADDDRYELFVQRFAQFEPDLRRFIRSLLPTSTDADDVLQQTAIVIWRKFEQYDPDTHFMKWACVIARFEALAFRRKMARDRLVFREDVLSMMADEGAEELRDRRDEHKALQACLRELTDKHRQLVTLAYTPGVKVKNLAEEAGSTAAAFYMRLNRLRRRLMHCVETRVQQTSQT